MRASLRVPLAIVPIMPQRHKDAPPEQDLYAPIEWSSAGEYDDIRYEKADGIAKITIDRPEVRNAFRPQTLVEISAALELAREDTEVGVVVLTGEGEKAFCSGGDQSVRGDTGYVAEGASLGRFHVTDLQVQMRRLPKPVVAMVAGYAVGGGHVLHVCCDLTIAADNARFGQTGPRVGSWDGGFGASLLRDLVGTKKAKEFWLLCRQYDAEEALEMGLVNTVVPLDRLERETVAWCREMLALSPFALRLVKASFNAHEDGYAGIQQLAHDTNLLFYGSEEAREGREAFKEKRQPDFSQVPEDGHEDLADGGTAADAAGGDRAGAGRHRGGGRMGRQLPRAGAFVAALVGSIFIQIGTNLANDYSDAQARRRHRRPARAGAGHLGRAGDAAAGAASRPGSPSRSPSPAASTWPSSPGS